MAFNKLNKNRDLNGLNSPLSYMGINAIGAFAASQTVTLDRAPTTSDYNNFIIGCFWIMPSTSTNPAIPNSRFFYLAALSNNQATWVEIEGVIAAALTITGDAGGALSPVADNWNIVGGAGISTSGAGNTLTITNTDPASDLTLTADAGGAIFPLLGNWNIEGGTGITTSGAGNTITITSSGSEIFTYTDVSASPYVVLVTDNFISVDCSIIPITIQLPDAATLSTAYVIKDRTGSASTNNITVTSLSGVILIDGATTFVMNTDYESIRVLGNGTNWEVF